MATNAFKPALRDSETCGSGLIEESGTLRRYGQGRVEDQEGSIDRCLRLLDLTPLVPTGVRTPVSHSRPSINAYLRVRLDTKEPRTDLLRRWVFSRWS